MARQPFNRIWTEDPVPEDFSEPDDIFWREGWRGGEDQDPPEAYAQNWWQNRADEALRDIERGGAMEWLSTVPYQMWATARASDGTVYIAIQPNENVDPVADNGSNWLSVPDYIKSRLNATGNAPMFAVRAWGDLNGDGVSIINAGGNVSSFSRASAGVYSISFETSMPSSSYSVCGTSGELGDYVFAVQSKTSGGFDFTVTDGDQGLAEQRDTSRIMFQVVA